MGASHENWRKLVLFWMNAENMSCRCPELWQWRCVPGWSDLIENLRRLSRESGRFFFSHKSKSCQESSFGRTEWRRFSSSNQISRNEFATSNGVTTYPTLRRGYWTSHSLLMKPGSVFRFFLTKLCFKP
jgi:hypothetical protein